MAADEASLSTDTLAMSCGLTVSRSPSTPSISTSAPPPEPIDPVPRMSIVAAREGLPSRIEMLRLGMAPCNERETLGLERSANCLLSTWSTAPIRSRRLTEP